MLLFSDKYLCFLVLLVVITVVNCKYMKASEPFKGNEIDDIKEYNIKQNGECDYFEDRLVGGLIYYGITGDITNQLQKDLNKVATLKFQLFPNSEPEEKKGKLQQFLTEVSVCTLCRTIARTLLTYRNTLGTKSAAVKAVKLLCYRFQPKRVCDGLVDLNIDIFWYILGKKKLLTSSRICSIIAQSHNCEDSFTITPWRVYLAPKSLLAPKQQSQNNDKPLRILHITDIHYDEKYTAGGNAKCGEPICAGKDQGKPETPKDAAGVWGDYRTCDTPINVVKNMMDSAAKHDIDYIYHTGDIVSHRVWETSIKTNTRSILLINQLFRHKFPNKTIYHIAGNHEPNPLNEFAPEHITQQNLSTHWLYDMLAKEWGTWLPKDTQLTIRKGGYYTVLVRPGFRIIALNSNVCYIYNWWLLFKNIDPYGQLQWLADTLHQAELDGEIIHILSHVPSGDKECYKVWSNEYNRIIQRYAEIIKGQFVGHTHFNELHFYFKKGYEDPINVAFNGGSVSTYINVNPNYRIYEVNPNTYQIEDYDEWIYNITEANENDITVPPRWYKLYSFKEAYGLKSMDLPELGKLVRSLAKNSTLADTYFKLKVRHGDPFLKKGCNQKCHEEQLCNLVTSKFGDNERCEKLLEEYRSVHNF